MSGSKYWDLFETRIVETIEAISNGNLPPLRRLSLHITNQCNLKCSYCNERHTITQFDEEAFYRIVREYNEMGGGILHITGGEPTCVSWLYHAFLETARYSNVDLHLNTNLCSDIPYDVLRRVKRLKVSLDSHDAKYFDELVGIPNSFNKVLNNLKKIDALNSLGEGPIVSITYTMTKENYKHIPDFLDMYYTELPHLYAVFFSAYKGTNERFAFDNEATDDLFANVVPEINYIMDAHSDTESKFLFHASHDEKTFDKEVRFPENDVIPCYLQFSELSLNESGMVSNCSHLQRDGVSQTGISVYEVSLQEAFKKAKEISKSGFLHSKCKYGCNKKLVTFNKEVANGLV